MDPDTLSQRALHSSASQCPLAVYSGAMQCPKCGTVNQGGVQFCTQCHFILLHRCPNCWHEQAQGGLCEKCGLNFDAYWNLYLLKQADQRAREDVETIKAWGGLSYRFCSCLTPRCVRCCASSFFDSQACASWAVRPLSCPSMASSHDARVSLPG